jgi:hypothetical protein
MWLLWDPMHFAMEHRMLRGIKERAEGVPLEAPAVEIAARVGWTLAVVGLLGLFPHQPTITARRSRVRPLSLDVESVDASCDQQQRAVDPQCKYHALDTAYTNTL